MATWDEAKEELGPGTLLGVCNLGGGELNKVQKAKVSKGEQR